MILKDYIKSRVTEKKLILFLLSGSLIPTDRKLLAIQVRKDAKTDSQLRVLTR